ncbi:MAG: Spo0E family sporulation regulatory protein-aspartic acid phosphatase [Oscillospiraceae bacterium]|jgi:hypothetical protein|nr:Spo0E family sporulation regulatory protein-aspartic acid phosphatase [Oscillospiraceae bacterium]
MQNLIARIDALREQLAELYLKGEKARALIVSQRLDLLIALAQREKCLTVTLGGQQIPPPHP